VQDLLRLKLTVAIASHVPRLTRRDIRLPAVPKKALGVIGVRRSGKTTFLWQVVAAVRGQGLRLPNPTTDAEGLWFRRPRNGHKPTRHAPASSL